MTASLPPVFASHGAHAAPLLLTARLRLVAPDPRLGAALADFHVRNHAHLAPWEPPVAPDFFTEAAQTERLREAATAFASGSAYRYLLQPIGDPAHVVGSVHFSNILRGPSQSCALGYALDQKLEGQALMSEALRCAIGEMFSVHVNLHRIQAAFRPENWRSAEVLKRLGFHDEGLARDYLFVEGTWRVHRIASLLNHGFVPPKAWQGGNV
jgi:ribosomal-protein-alanine N-acetyltransferase